MYPKLLQGYRARPADCPVPSLSFAAAFDVQLGSHDRTLPGIAVCQASLESLVRRIGLSTRLRPLTLSKLHHRFLCFFIWVFRYNYFLFRTSLEKVALE